MQAIRRNASLDMSLSFFEEIQLSQLPTKTNNQQQNNSLHFKLIDYLQRNTNAYGMMLKL